MGSGGFEIAAGLLFILASFITVGVLFITVANSPDSCGANRIEPKGQVYCNYTLGQKYKKFKINFNDTSYSGLTSYVFTKRPKKYLDYKDYHYPISHKMVYTLNVVAEALTKFKLNVEATSPVTVEFIGTPVGEKSSKFLFRKKDLSVSGDFELNQTYTSARFLLTGDDFFDATFNLTVGWPKFDVNSVSYVEKTRSYPHEWNFDDDKLSGSDLYFITENSGEKSFVVYGSIYGSSVGYIVGGVVFIVVGVILFVVGLVVFLVFSK